MKFFAVALLFPLFALTQKSFAQDNLIGIDHRLARFVQNGETVDLSTSRPITLRFLNDRRTAGTSAVNNYFGAYHLDQTGNFYWALPGVGSTMMAGPEELMSLESRYFQALASARFFTPSATGFLLQNFDKTTTLEFETTSTDAILRALRGKKLLVARLISEGNEVQLPAEPILSFTLDDNDRVQGFSGVNQYSGSLKPSSASEVSFRAFAVTRRAGPPELMDLERLYLRALGATAEWSISLNGAILRSTDGTFVIELVTNRD